MRYSQYPGSSGITSLTPNPAAPEAYAGSSIYAPAAPAVKSPSSSPSSYSSKPSKSLANSSAVTKSFGSASVNSPLPTRF